LLVGDNSRTLGFWRLTQPVPLRFSPRLVSLGCDEKLRAFTLGRRDAAMGNLAKIVESGWDQRLGISSRTEGLRNATARVIARAWCAVK